MTAVNSPFDETHAVLRVGAAVAAAHDLDDVIEAAAEEARHALSAATMSISRLEGDDDPHLRTLINVGELGPTEERRPDGELYRVAEFQRLVQMFGRRRPHRTNVDDPDGDDSERALLRRLGKGSGVAVPIIVGDRVWGELYATRHAGEDPFGEDDVSFLHAIASQLAAAIGRAETFSQMAELAFEDALTGLANRRALDDALEAQVAAALDTGADLALVLCDLDNLKEINDGSGHHAGDAALVRVARALRGAADGETDVVARLGGDEFCLVLPGTTAAHARTCVEHALRDLGDGVGLSAGIASLGTGARRPGDLMRAADAALYTAKRNGRGRVFVARSGEVPKEAPGVERRALPSAAVAGNLHSLTADTVEQLDAMPGNAFERLSAAVERTAVTGGMKSWAISHADAGADVVRTVVWHDTRFHEGGVDWADTADEIYPIDQYPSTAKVLREGGSFVVRADDPEADPAEVALLVDGGVSSVVAVGIPWEGGAWLVELYGHEGVSDPAVIEPYLRLLAAEAVRGAR